MTTGGASITVKLEQNLHKKAQPYFSHANMSKLQRKLGLSDRKTKETAHFLRTEQGRKSVQKGLEQKFISANHSSEDPFKIEIISYSELKP